MKNDPKIEDLLELGTSDTQDNISVQFQSPTRNKNQSLIFLTQ